jgi:hypothetical protein
LALARQSGRPGAADRKRGNPGPYFRMGSRSQMFNIIRPKSYYWPVKVETPRDGKIETETFDALFRVLSQTEIEACFADKEKSVDEVIKRVLVGWRGIVDGETVIEFSLAELDRLLEIVGMRSFILKAWIASVTGESARRKN